MVNDVKAENAEAVERYPRHRIETVEGQAQEENRITEGVNRRAQTAMHDLAETDLGSHCSRRRFHTASSAFATRATRP